MTITLQPMNSMDNCPICYQAMGGTLDFDPDTKEKIDKDVIGHMRDTEKSCCYHRVCFEESAKYTKELRCWICAQSINPDSLPNNTWGANIEPIVNEEPLQVQAAQITQIAMDMLHNVLNAIFK